MKVQVEINFLKEMFCDSLDQSKNHEMKGINFNKPTDLT